MAENNKNWLKLLRTFNLLVDMTYEYQDRLLYFGKSKQMPTQNLYLFSTKLFMR